MAGFDKKPPLGLKGGKASARQKFKTLDSGESNNSAVKKPRKLRGVAKASQDYTKGSDIASTIPPASNLTTPLKDARSRNGPDEPRPAGLNDA